MSSGNTHRRLPSCLLADGTDPVLGEDAHPLFGSANDGPLHLPFVRPDDRDRDSHRRRRLQRHRRSKSRSLNNKGHQRQGSLTWGSTTPRIGTESSRMGDDNCDLHVLSPYGEERPRKPRPLSGLSQSALSSQANVGVPPHPKQDTCSSTPLADKGTFLRVTVGKGLFACAEEDEDLNTLVEGAPLSLTSGPSRPKATDDPFLTSPDQQADQFASQSHSSSKPAIAPEFEGVIDSFGFVLCGGVTALTCANGNTTLVRSRGSSQTSRRKDPARLREHLRAQLKQQEAKQQDPVQLPEANGPQSDPQLQSATDTEPGAPEPTLVVKETTFNGGSSAQEFERFAKRRERGKPCREVQIARALKMWDEYHATTLETVRAARLKLRAHLGRASDLAPKSPLGMRAPSAPNTPAPRILRERGTRPRPSPGANAQSNDLTMNPPESINDMFQLPNRQSVALGSSTDDELSDSYVGNNPFATNSPDHSSTASLASSTATFSTTASNRTSITSHMTKCDLAPSPPAPTTPERPNLQSPPRPRILTPATHCFNSPATRRLSCSATPSRRPSLLEINPLHPFGPSQPLTPKVRPTTTPSQALGSALVSRNRPTTPFAFDEQARMSHHLSSTPGVKTLQSPAAKVPAAPPTPAPISTPSAQAFANLPSPFDSPTLVSLVEKVGLDPRLRAEAWFHWSGAVLLKAQAEAHFKLRCAQQGFDDSNIEELLAVAATCQPTGNPELDQLLDGIDTPLHLLTYGQLLRRPRYSREVASASHFAAIAKVLKAETGCTDVTDKDRVVAISCEIARRGAAETSGCGLVDEDGKPLSRPAVPTLESVKAWKQGESAVIFGADSEHRQNISRFLPTPEIFNHMHSILEQIDRDLPRTTCNHPFFVTPMAHAALQRILTAYAYRNPGLGYLQSMNFLVALGLAVLGPDREEDVFWLLAAIVEDLLPEHYTQKMRGLRTLMTIFSKLVESDMPRLHKQLSDSGVDLGFKSVSWFLCLFFTYLPPETVVNCWDVMFMHAEIARTKLMRASQASTMNAETQPHDLDASFDVVHNDFEDDLVTPSPEVLAFRRPSYSAPPLSAFIRIEQENWALRLEKHATSGSKKPSGSPIRSSMSPVGSEYQSFTNPAGSVFQSPETERDLVDCAHSPIYFRVCAVLCSFGLGLLEDIQIRIDRACNASQIAGHRADTQVDDVPLDGLSTAFGGAKTLKISEIVQNAGTYVCDAHRLQALAFKLHPIASIVKKIIKLHSEVLIEERNERLAREEARRRLRMQREAQRTCPTPAHPAQTPGRFKQFLTGLFSPSKSRTPAPQLNPMTPSVLPRASPRPMTPACENKDSEIKEEPWHVVSRPGNHRRQASLRGKTPRARPDDTIISTTELSVFRSNVQELPESQGDAALPTTLAVPSNSQPPRHHRRRSSMRFFKPSFRHLHVPKETLPVAGRQDHLHDNTPAHLSEHRKASGVKQSPTPKPASLTDKVLEALQHRRVTSVFSYAAVVAAAASAPNSVTPSHKRVTSFGKADITNRSSQNVESASSSPQTESKPQHRRRFSHNRSRSITTLPAISDSSASVIESSSHSRASYSRFFSHPHSSDGTSMANQASGCVQSLISPGAEPRPRPHRRTYSQALLGIPEDTAVAERH